MHWRYKYPIKYKSKNWSYDKIGHFYGEYFKGRIKRKNNYLDEKFENSSQNYVEVFFMALENNVLGVWLMI